MAHAKATQWRTRQEAAGAITQSPKRSQASTIRAQTGGAAQARQAGEMIARLNAEQRRALELFTREPRGVTGHLLVNERRFEMKMLAGLAHEGLVAAVVGESTRAGGKAIEVVRFWITAVGRRALDRRPTTRSRQRRLCWLASVTFTSLTCFWSIRNAAFAASVGLVYGVVSLCVLPHAGSGSLFALKGPGLFQSD